MWTSEHHGRSSAAPERVFALLADVTSWPSWNAGVAHIDLDGPFAAGSTAEMTFPDGSRLPFTITEVEPGAAYEDLTRVPDAGVDVRVRHEVVADGAGCRIVYRCTVEGATPEVCAEVGRAVSADFDAVIGALAVAAER